MPLQALYRVQGLKAPSPYRCHNGVTTHVHPSWKTALDPEFDKPYFKSLLEFVKQERAETTVYPPQGQVFTAFKTPLDKVRVLILGQDPYHGRNQAQALCRYFAGLEVPGL